MAQKSRLNYLLDQLASAKRAVCIEVDENPPEGTALESAKELHDLVDQMVKEFGDFEFLERIDKERAKTFEPGEKGFSILAKKLDQMADNLSKLRKVLSSFAARINSGKILDPNLETDMGIQVDTENLEHELSKLENEFRKDAQTLREL